MRRALWPARKVPYTNRRSTSAGGTVVDPVRRPARATAVFTTRPGSGRHRVLHGDLVERGRSISVGAQLDAVLREAARGDTGSGAGRVGDRGAPRLAGAGGGG